MSGAIPLQPPATSSSPLIVAVAPVVLMHILNRNVSKLELLLSVTSHAGSTQTPDVMLLFLPHVTVASGSSHHSGYISLSFHEFVQ
jgi:hypothetical protein